MYKAAVKHSPIGIGLCAPEDRFLDANRALCALTSHEVRALCKRDLFGLCHPGHIERTRHGIESLLIGQRDMLSMGTHLVRQDGTTVWMQTDVAVAHDHGNQHLAVQVQDVTTRRLALGSLCVSEQRLVYMPGGAGLDTFSQSTRVRHVLFSRRTVDMPGYESVDLSNDPDAWFAMVYPQDVASSAWRIYHHMHGDADSFKIEQRMHARHGQWIRVVVRGRVAERDAHGMATHVSDTLLDATKRHTALDQAHHLTLHDPLIDSPNARLLRDRLFVAVRVAYHARGRIVVVFVDLDCFKSVNDKYGHAVGDLVLKATAVRLHNGLRASDTVARLGGDEFVVIPAHCATRDDVTRIIEHLTEQLQTPFRVEGHVLSLGVSVDMALYPTGGHDAQTLTRNTDVTMYEVKRAGGNGLGFHVSPSYERLMGMRSHDRDLDGKANAHQSITAR